MLRPVFTNFPIIFSYSFKMYLQVVELCIGLNVLLKITLALITFERNIITMNEWTNEWICKTVCKLFFLVSNALLQATSIQGRTSLASMFCETFVVILSLLLTCCYFILITNLLLTSYLYTFYLFTYYLRLIYLHLIYLHLIYLLLIYFIFIFLLLIGYSLLIHFLLQLFCFF